jgi:hypothetical protein
MNASLVSGDAVCSLSTGSESSDMLEGNKSCDEQIQPAQVATSTVLVSHLPILVLNYCLGAYVIRIVGRSTTWPRLAL